MIGIILSLITFFFSWQIALSGLIFFIALERIARHFGKRFIVSTIRELIEKIVSEEYIRMRRDPQSINPKEALNIIIDTFCEEFSLDRNTLSRDAPFNWAKVCHLPKIS